MSGQGFIKLYRKIENHWLFDEKRKFSKFEAWVDLLLNANHSDNKFMLGNELIEVKRGQLVTSVRKLCDKWGWSNTKTISFLKTLKNDSMIEYKNDTKKTVITIMNYGFYHDYDNEKTTQKRHENRHKNDTEQTQKHTNKNEKNEKNEEETNNTTKSPEKRIMEFWDSNGFGYNNINAKNKLLMFLDEGLESDVIIKALEIATENNKISYAYVEKILKDWSQRDLNTIELVNAAQAERQRQMEQQQTKPRGGYSRKSVRTEIDPDEHFKEQKENGKQSDEEKARKKKEIEEMMKLIDD